MQKELFPLAAVLEYASLPSVKETEITFFIVDSSLVENVAPIPLSPSIPCENVNLPLDAYTDAEVTATMSAIDNANKIAFLDFVVDSSYLDLIVFSLIELFNQFSFADQTL